METTVKTKKIRDLVEGDVINTEYGVEGNWVCVKVNKIKQISDNEYKLYCEYVDKHKSKVTMYGYGFEPVDIVKEAK